MPEYKAFAEHTKQFRKEMKESPKEFAFNRGISKGTLSLIEREMSNPTLEMIKMITSYAGCTVSDLLKVED